MIHSSSEDCAAGFSLFPALKDAQTGRVQRHLPADRATHDKPSPKDSEVAPPPGQRGLPRGIQLLLFRVRSGPGSISQAERALETYLVGLAALQARSVRLPGSVDPAQRCLPGTDS